MYLAAESAPFKELSWKPHNFFLTSNWLFVSTGEAGKCSWGTLVSPHNTDSIGEKEENGHGMDKQDKGNNKNHIDLGKLSQQICIQTLCLDHKVMKDKIVNEALKRQSQPQKARLTSLQTKNKQK